MSKRVTMGELDGPPAWAPENSVGSRLLCETLLRRAGKYSMFVISQNKKKIVGLQIALINPSVQH